MRQRVVKGPLKINVIMRALRGGLSGLGTDQQEEEEEGATSITLHQQNLLLTKRAENKQGFPAAFHQQL